jgi:phage terminase large subunit
MHTLYNMALVDKETNSALSNNLLDRKREILRDYQERKETYVLPSTQKVFSKYYSQAKEENVLP